VSSQIFIEISGRTHRKLREFNNDSDRLKQISSQLMLERPHYDITGMQLNGRILSPSAKAEEYSLSELEAVINVSGWKFLRIYWSYK
jgi:hypothetical protein